MRTIPTPDEVHRQCRRRFHILVREYAHIERLARLKVPRPFSPRPLERMTKSLEDERYSRFHDCRNPLRCLTRLRSLALRCEGTT